MYICPECGTEYAVVPDACTVCGHEPADTEHIDLFAAAAAQERKAAEQQSKRQQEYQTRAAAAQESEELPEAAPVPKQDSGTLPDSGAVPSGKKKSRTALKAAALCTAAALVMGGGAYWGFMRGKPAGFQKTAFSTFYLKDNDLWYQNGQTAKTLCLSNEVIKSDGYMSDSDISSASYFLDSMLTVSADGTDLYYPKQLDIEHISEQQCFTLMHCTAEHPEEAEEIADIRLTESLYAMAWSNSALLRSVYSSSFQSNSYLSNEPALYDMNPMYLLCGDAVYHRNQNGEFCCTRNGETEVIAPIVERFWIVPDQERVYYITIPDYDEYKERMQVRDPLDAYRPDSNCMNSEAIVTKTDGGYEQQLHSADYALFATAPGEKPERAINVNFEDWKPIEKSNPDCLFYTVSRIPENKTLLRRFRFDTGQSETVCEREADGKLILLRDYPGDCCYYAYCKLTESRIGDWMPYTKYAVSEEEALNVMGYGYRVSTEDVSGMEMYYVTNSLVPMDQATIFYQEAGQEPAELIRLLDMYYSETNNTCPGKPYIWAQEQSNSYRKTHVYYRGEEINLNYAAGTKMYTSPDSIYFTGDGSRIMAVSNDYNFSSYSDFYLADTAKTMTGELNGAEPVEMQLVANAEDQASVVAVMQENGPAEILRVTDYNMYSGEEKLASGVYPGIFYYQPEYRQLCFIANDSKVSASSSSVIPMSLQYCGTLMRRANRETKIVAENVTDFIPADKTHFAVICGERETPGTLTICTENGFYQADTGVTKLLGVRELSSSKGFFSGIFQ